MLMVHMSDSRLSANLSAIDPASAAAAAPTGEPMLGSVELADKSSGSNSVAERDRDSSMDLSPGIHRGQPGAARSTAELSFLVQKGIRGVLSRGDSGVNRPGGTVTKQYGAAVATLGAKSQTRFQSKAIIPTFDFSTYKGKTFAKLRRVFGVTDAELVSSLCDYPLRTQSGTGDAGKSGSIFWFTSDSKYLLKSISRKESMLLQNIVGDYLKHFIKNSNSILCRFFALFKIKLQGFKRSTRFVVMNNIFGGLSCQRKYDLKGTTEDRYVAQNSDLMTSHGTDQGSRAPPGTNSGQETPRSPKVLKDLNFSGQTVMLPEVLCAAIKSALVCDTEFLMKHRIMDYSLILGIHETCDVAAVKALVDADQVAAAIVVSSAPATPSGVEPRSRLFELYKGGVPGWDDDRGVCMVYYVGIIDILQQYTFKKRAARLMKKYTIGCFHEIDTEPPEYYRNRFVKYLDEKFVPLSDADLSKKHAEVPEVQSFLMSQAIRENQSEGCQRTVK
ncbi:Phosphatidylinositol-4-phosphate 5-kinase type-1 alpha, putative [Perkinsus marinus ATCC 50983]|uniref:Phosphatidylinositol-4-phosphate 5-kinase type-1 alpha, putative n=1 Tax=Perkinsus marinus (strain ATCC 50983 / TXsc) TaxID=423536 RepID=C5KJH1_PERM5|nr:Phosphatidylinositol-4-phosphate 5-kinase type-1 alpha, putative [Perkinsus marinus ATCC 50983]EER15305.1 Phosphatidylinositol-4-phosphate 5-kinase type-1 alpha, putative [Perkinsus marinus ATCC 50983]|eukprot:XP_002783509.1 Phosphatidylinositol-4-phosphate 5-kinase type-1 alpha, putative [Perkinsus marinus ATCC 50983]